MKTALLGAAAVAATTLLAPAAQAGPGTTWDRFTHEPTGFDVRAKHHGGAMCLKGINKATGETFDVHVSRSGRVTGTWKGNPVDMKLGKEPRTELASLR